MKEYFVDEAAVDNFVDVAEVEYELELEEIKLEEIKLQDLELDFDLEEEATEPFSSESSTEGKSNLSQSSGASAVEMPAIKPIFSSFTSFSARGFESEKSTDLEDSSDSEQGDVDYLEMEEMNLENVKVVVIPEECDDNKSVDELKYSDVMHNDFDDDVVTRNEKYSYYYN